jgi:Xaa-Pro dipeptidase
MPKDFWYEHTPLDGSFWIEGFDIVETSDLKMRWSFAADSASRVAYIGNETELAMVNNMDPNPVGLTAFLDWGRSYKTLYEVKCLEEANAACAKGQTVGRMAFLAGASELEIHHAFLEAVGISESGLAFPSIVALNEKSAILHYDNKRNLRNGKTLLLDCGVRVRSYASDITRTTTSVSCNNKFKELVVGMEKNHKELIEAIVPGIFFSDIHHLSHLKLAFLLNEQDILYANPEQAVALKLTRPFYPHGLGHYLGIQVHDVAGKLAGPDGRLVPPPLLYPNLNTTRKFDYNQVITIEPGCYFIPMLLRQFREGCYSKYFNWKLIDELSCLGGIRIEDDVLITKTGCRNLTRQYLLF